MVKNEVEKFDESIIRDRIYSIRGYQVMLDSDLAELYGVETKRLNEAVKRNNERFPEEFCFQLLFEEYESLVIKTDSQTKDSIISRSQIATSILANRNYGKIKKGGRTNLPYAFSEHGVVMLSSVLRSERAIEINIKIVKAFIEMRKFFQTNLQIFQRLDRVELKQIETDNKVEKILNVMESKDHIPEQGIFFEGQVFDAYKFVSDLFRTVEKSIVIADNYIDDTVIVHLTKLKEGVLIKIITKSVSDQLRLDIDKFESQYSPIEIKILKNIHDRFIIIDGKIVYLFGASLKDLGKKLFGFMKMDKLAMKLIDEVEKI